MSQSVQRCLWNLICPCEALLFCCLDHSPVRCAAMNHQLLHRTVEKLRTSQSGTRLCPDTQYRVSIYLQSQALSLSASSRAFYWWLSCGKAVLNQGTYGQPWTTWTAVELSKTYKQTSTYTLSMLSPLPGICFLITLRTAGLGEDPGVLLLCCGLLSSITGKQDMYSWEPVECDGLSGFVLFFKSNIDLYSSSCGTPSYTINKNNITIIVWYVYAMTTLKTGFHLIQDYYS